MSDPQKTKDIEVTAHWNRVLAKHNCGCDVNKVLHELNPKLVATTPKGRIAELAESLGIDLNRDPGGT